MKFSKTQRTKFFSYISLLVVLIAVPTSSVRAEFTDINQLSQGLDSLIGNLQRVQSLAGAGTGGGTAISTQLSSSLNTLTNLSSGLQTLNNLTNIPVLSQNGGFQSVQGLNDSIQGLGAILDTPLFSNFEGAQKLSSTLNTVGNAATALSNIGGILDIPELKNLGGLINPGGTGGTTGGVGGGLGSIFGSSDGTNQLSTGLQKLTSVLGNNTPAIGAISAISGINGLDALKTAVGNIPAQGTGFLSDTNSSCASGISSSGSSFTDSAVNTVAQAASDKAKSAIGSFFNNAVGPLGSIIGGSIGTNTKGVPVIEQDGTLINLSRQSANLASIICQHLATIRAIEEFKNPDARLAAQKQLETQLDLYRTQEKTGRTNAAGVSGQSFIVGRQQYIDEKVRAETGRALTQLANAPIPSSFKQSVLNQITREQIVNQDRAQGLIALVQGSQSQSNDPWDNWVQSLRPENNPIGSYMLAQEYVNQIKANAAEDAAQTWEAGGGYAPDEVCVGGYVDTPVGKVCSGQQQVVKPGSFLQNRSTVVDTSGIRVAEQTNQFQGDRISQQALADERESSLGDNQGRKDIGVSEIFGVVDEICKVKADLGICNTKNKAQNILNTLTQVTGVDLFGGQSGTANITSGLSGSSNSVSSGLSASQRTTPPTISFSTSDTPIPGKSNFVEIGWQAQGATSCVVANDWITYGDNGEVTLFPSVKVPQGTQTSAQNSVTISRPALYTVEVAVRGSGVEQTNIASKFNSGLQVVGYIPNVEGIQKTDQFQLTINGQTITTRSPLPGTAPADIVAELKSAKASLPNGSAEKAEFDQYQFGGSTSLTISRGLPGGVPTSAQYTLQCSGPGGSATKTATINF